MFYKIIDILIESEIIVIDFLFILLHDGSQTTLDGRTFTGKF